VKSKTMIYLEPEQLQSLRNEARNRRISLAELFRRLVQDYLGRERPLTEVPPEAYKKIIGLGSSGKQDIAEKHDEYLGKALSREHTR
jgi:hypothetical protein